MNKVEVEFYGKTVTGDQIEPGVVKRATRKGAKSYLIKCSETGKFCYCSPERLEKLSQRFGSVAGVGQEYVSREGKAIRKANA